MHCCAEEAPTDGSPASLSTVYDDPRAHYYSNDELLCICIERFRSVVTITVSHGPLHCRQTSNLNIAILGPTRRLQQTLLIHCRCRSMLSEQKNPKSVCSGHLRSLRGWRRDWFAGCWDVVGICWSDPAIGVKQRCGPHAHYGSWAAYILGVIYLKVVWTLWRDKPDRSQFCNLFSDLNFNIDWYWSSWRLVLR